MNRSAFFGIVGVSLVICVALVAAGLGIRSAFGETTIIAGDPIPLTVWYSTEKDAWMENIMGDFNGTVNGRPIEVTFLDSTGSRDMYLAVLDETEQPDVISPASSLQISLLDDLSRTKFGETQVDVNSCQSVVETPLVLVAWAERAEVLWGDNPNGQLWQRLHDAVVSNNGWADYGHPEWGFIKFNHTNPTRSNSGLMTILLMAYGYHGKTDSLTNTDILDQDFQQWFVELEGSISEFGDSTGSYMRDMIAFGPSRYDIIAVYESTAIEQADNAVGRYGELRIYYPPATVMSDHPFCTLTGAWVTPEKAQAADVFVDYLLSEAAQRQAFSYGFRPADVSIALDGPGSPFLQYANNGIQLDIPPEVEVPPGNVLDTLIQFWDRTIQ